MNNSGKIKILHITQVQGGVLTYIEQMYNYIDKSKFEFEIACPENQNSIVEFAKKNAIPIHFIDLKWQISLFDDYKSVLEIIQLVKKVRPDLIHSHSSKAGFITRFASVFFKTKVIYTPHAYAYLGASGIKKTFFLTLEKLAKLVTDYVLATSYSEKKRAINDVGLSSKKVLVYRNCVEIPTISSYDKAINQTPIITTVGRFVEQKNPMMFLRVCKILKDKGINAKFQIIGSGFDDHLGVEIDKFIYENKLSDYVVTYSWMNKTQLQNKIINSDVFVMTSNFESFGYVAAEAQALQIPVVSTDVDGLNEIVADGVSGYLVKLNDDHHMANQIQKLLQDKDLAIKMGISARERMIKDFDVSKNISEIETIYHSLV